MYIILQTGLHNLYLQPVAKKDQCELLQFLEKQNFSLQLLEVLLWAVVWLMITAQMKIWQLDLSCNSENSTHEYTWELDLRDGAIYEVQITSLDGIA